MIKLETLSPYPTLLANPKVNNKNLSISIDNNQQLLFNDERTQLEKEYVNAGLSTAYAALKRYFTTPNQWAFNCLLTILTKQSTHIVKRSGYRVRGRSEENI